MAVLGRGPSTGRSTTRIRQGPPIYDWQLTSAELAMARGLDLPEEVAAELGGDVPGEALLIRTTTMRKLKWRLREERDLADEVGPLQGLPASRRSGRQTRSAAGRGQGGTRRRARRRRPRPRAAPGQDRRAGPGDVSQAHPVGDQPPRATPRHRHA